MDMKTDMYHSASEKFNLKPRTKTQEIPLIAQEKTNLKDSLDLPIDQSQVTNRGSGTFGLKISNENFETPTTNKADIAVIPEFNPNHSENESSVDHLDGKTKEVKF